jgi:hypothetical protein
MVLRRRATTVPAPYVVNPSEKFEGPDGQWSSFVISVGTPPQDYRVLPSTFSGEAWVIAPEGCDSSDVTDCYNIRGGDPFSGVANKGFQASQSSTWKEVGIYTLDVEKNLGYPGSGLYGQDVLGLNGGNGSSSGVGLSIPGQTIAAIADKSFLLGILGLGTTETAFSNNAAGRLPLISALKNNNFIPSVSYGYTAGAAYRK